jgi:glycosyltransferase involved in cell wall biosynthesis
MKIALVAPPWNPIPPEKYGGSESVVDGLARALVRQGHDVHLFALEGSTCPVPTTYIARGDEPWPYSPVCHENHFVMEVFDRIEGFDVVHDHTILGAAYGRMLQPTPVVTTNHGPFIGSLNTHYDHVAEWATVVAISHAQAATANVECAVVHHGVDVDEYSYGEGLGDERGEYFLFLGRISEIKGPHLAALAARDAGVRLVIAAKMAEEAEFQFFREHVEPLLGDGIEFIGEVGGERKRELLQNARALINPITWPEPFGLVMAESLACGTPVIALDNGPAREIIDEGVTGRVCRSVDQIVTAIQEVDSFDRKACRRAVEQYFNLDRMATDYVDVYARAIAESRALHGPAVSAPVGVQVRGAADPGARVPVAPAGAAEDAGSGDTADGVGSTATRATPAKVIDLRPNRTTTPI